MGKISFTDEQTNALDARGRVLVSAAAGSGKTAVLVERAVRYMTVEPVVPADRLLILTFTNAAAAEMKARIASKLKERAIEIGNPDLLKRQQYLLSIAKVCTIDSFCISLVREYFYKAGFSPDFKISEQSELSVLKNEAINETVEHFFALGGEDFDILCEIIGEERADESFKSTILAIYNEACNHPFPLEYIDSLAKMYSEFNVDNSEWLKVILKNAEFELKHAQSLINKCKKYITIDEELHSKYVEALADYDNALQKSFEFTKNGKWDELYSLVSNFKPKRFGIYKGDQKDTAEQVRNYASKVRDIFKNTAKSMLSDSSKIKLDCKRLTPAVNLLTQAVKHFINEYSRLKAEQNCVDFIDAEYMALKLLCDENGQPSELANELSEHYFEVMVDEFQDINDLQNTIFNLLSNNGGKMFMVGDVKQSIYRFRNANPEIFIKNRRSLPAYEKDKINSKVIMSGNFRSAPQICDFVNKVFSRLMTEQTAGMDYTDEDKLKPMSKFAENVENRVVYELLDRSDVSDSMTAAQAEAYEIVRIVKKQLEQPPFITDGDSLRKAEYGDIAVLLRNGNYIPEIKKAFDNAGIPCSCKAGGNLLDYREIMLLMSVLETVNNPFRDINTAAVMLSPIFGFTADELTRLRLDSGFRSLYAAAGKSENEKIKSFYEKIRRWRGWSHTMNTGDLIRRICDDCSYFYIALTFLSGERSRTNILSFISIADGFDSGSDTDLLRFLRYVKRASQTDKAFGVQSGQTGQNSVQIITMHASKGLQYPICILAGLSAKINKTDSYSGILLDGDLGFGMTVCDPVRRVKYKTIQQSAIKIKRFRSQISEELCILYVAMTRAKEKLIMISTIDQRNKFKIDSSDGDLSYLITHASSFTDFMAAVYDCARDYSVKVNAELPENTSKTTKQSVMVSDEELQNLRNVLNYKYPFDYLNTISSKLTASGLAHTNYDKIFQLRAKPMFARDDKMSAAKRGTACHKFMELCDFNSAAENIQAEAQRLVEIGKMTEQDCSAVDAEKLYPFFKSELYKTISNADNIYREQKFMVYFPADEIYSDEQNQFSDEKIVVQGAADLIAVKGKHLYVLDYKTDKAVNADDLAEKYKGQLTVYRKAFERIFGCETSSAYIYSFYLSKTILIK